MEGFFKQVTAIERGTRAQYFTPNATEILCKRYFERGEDYPLCNYIQVSTGNIGCGERHETEHDFFWRISMGNADYLPMLQNLEFLPNSPTLFNMGTKSGGTLSACFKFDIDDTMFDSPSGIMPTAMKAAKVLKAGGGVGYVFSNLRPKGAPVQSTHGEALGAEGVARILHVLAKEITQGGKRDAAQMGIIHCDHPDAKNFIHWKDNDPDALGTFNISVALTDEFMRTALEDTETYEYAFLKQMAQSAWKTGDPGVFFIDAAERGNPTPWAGQLTGTNPCLIGTTRMLTAEGLVRIKDVKSETKFYTPSGWSQGRAWKTGHKDVVNVVLSNGMSILCTPDHEFVVDEYKFAASILDGAPIEPAVGKADWIGNDPYSDDDLMRLGYFFGDGSFIADTRGVYVHVGRDDTDVDNLLFSQYEMHGDRRRYIPAFDDFAQLLFETDLRLGNVSIRPIPETAWTFSPHSMRMFLKGVFSANGSVLKAAKRVTLKGTNLGAMRGIQQMLLALGFRPYITTNKPTQIQWPNGEFTSRESYDLNIVGSECQRFAREIGFIQQYKMSILDGFKVQPGRRLTPIVIAIEPVDSDDVYDFNVNDESHVGWANGFWVSNCGEVPLLNNEPCNLGSINLGKFVSPYMTNGRLDPQKSIDWDRLEQVARMATRYLDDVLDRNTFPDPDIHAAAIYTRKLGLGVCGFADLLTLMNIDYESDEAVTLGESIMNKINIWAQQESIRLADEKGRAPCFEEVFERPHFRNATRTCIAPTGTIAILMNASSGIEPYFALENTRTMGDGTTFVEKPWTLENREPWAAFPKTANEVSYEWHVKHQAAFQKHTDLAVSKTINMAESATPDDILQAYILMWKLGCKGGTVYRDKSRLNQVLKHIDSQYEEAQVDGFTLQYPADIKIGIDYPVHLSSVSVANRTNGWRDGLGDEAPGLRHKFEVGGMEGYVHVGLYPDGQPAELFLDVSRQGSMVSGMMDWVGQVTSLAFQIAHMNGTPFTKITEKWLGRKFEPSGFTGNPAIPRVESLADYLARWLHLKFAQGVQLAEATRADTCPDCGNHTLIHEGGCEHCTSCGFERC